MTDYRPLTDEERTILEQQKAMWERKKEYPTYLVAHATLMLEQGLAYNVEKEYKKYDDIRGTESDAYLLAHAELMLNTGIVAESNKKHQEFENRKKDCEQLLFEANSALEIINDQLTNGIEIRPSVIEEVSEIIEED